MTATVDLDLQVREFAQAVRLELADLGPEEVEELTDGLEADLSEQAGDSEGFTLGDPADYASELRSAAGLPARTVERPKIATIISAEAARVLRHVVVTIRASKTGASLLDFLASIRPVWWLARAMVGTIVLKRIVGAGWDFGAFSLISGAVLLVISIQWGRGRWMPWPGIRVIRTIANIAAVLLIPFALAAASSQLSYYVADQTMQAYAMPAGLSRDGRQVTNIFAYDSDGNPVKGVQLFDQDGKALSVRTDSTSPFLYAGGDTYLVPSAKTVGGSGWNVFPLARISQSAADSSTERLSAGTIPGVVLFPFVTVRPLLAAPVVTAGGTPTAQSTSAPVTSPSPSPTTAPPSPAPTP
jgi:hypothetical protein